jgi:hypothetical protein
MRTNRNNSNCLPKKKTKTFMEGRLKIVAEIRTYGKLTNLHPS